MTASDGPEPGLVHNTLSGDNVLQKTSGHIICVL